MENATQNDHAVTIESLFIVLVDARLNELELSAHQAEKKFRLPEGAIRNVLSNRVPSIARAKEIADALGIKFVIGDDKTQSPQKDERFVYIPRYDIKASAGFGRVAEPVVEKISELAFSASWVRARRFNPDYLRVVEVDGDSMYPALHHGDLILVDMIQKEPRSGKAYLIRQNDELLVKYVQLLPGGILRLSSDNKNYSDYDIDLSKNQHVEVIGKVVASNRNW